MGVSCALSEFTLRCIFDPLLGIVIMRAVFHV